ncbi:UPF0001 protein [Thiosulfatimonas sediminis]|uniref:Pyridoxal phosphate homeostasis protein n=1 Tax=Thiosulfatimonas sediminis TaxID=2675054 RepID=A0A6F8PXJ8_9GAMM|nr:YggS family pyridoxal phosphate-dependent enzyme [Thiosulfatimonas sediminis]BBP46767.1 UPF0001 protein [Thiosulfatimonas sediminis]
MERSEQLLHNWHDVTQRIHNACLQAQRDLNDVNLLAVSKTKPVTDIIALAQTGQVHFGENYLQEALDKISALPELVWHFIGPIQSNKTRPVAEHFTWVHSVDRLKIAQRLSEQRPAHLAPLNILLAVNIDREESKSGFFPEQLAATVAEILPLPNIQLRGLMTIPQAREQLSEQRSVFAEIHQLLSDLQQQFPQAQLDQLSMGMSSDLEAAIFEGATWVRIGTDLFGARDYTAKNSLKLASKIQKAD